MTNDNTTTELVMPERLDYEFDNRDDGTTWIWVSDTQYIEIMTSDLLRHIEENSFATRFLAISTDEIDTDDTFNEYVDTLKNLTNDHTIYEAR